MQIKRSIEIIHGLSQISVTPLINVIFLLLLFFILSSTLVYQPGITVKLPRALTSESIKEDDLTIVITGENVMYLNGKVTALKALRQELHKKKNKNRLLLIKADRHASLGRIVDVWDLSRDLGVEKVSIITNQEK